MAKDQGLTSRYEAAGASDTGKRRPGNEDAYGIEVDPLGSQGNFVVCDGMGGAAAGEIASRLAVEAMMSELRRDALTGEQVQESIQAVNSLVYSRAERDLRFAGMGTTLVALAARGARAWIANVGDSRCYRFRDGALQSLTHDHSLVDEQVRSGLMTQAEAAVSPMRNVITRAIGTGERVEADIFEVEIQQGDLYLLTSDGLTREIPDSKIAQILAAEILRGPNEPEKACRALIEAANRSGGNDNITCLLVRCN